MTIDATMGLTFERDPTLLFNKLLWRIGDVAKALGVSVGHIYNLVSRREIPYRKKGKLLFFIPTEIHDWINEGDVK